AAHVEEPAQGRVALPVEKDLLADALLVRPASVERRQLRGMLLDRCPRPRLEPPEEPAPDAAMGPFGVDVTAKPVLAHLVGGVDPVVPAVRHNCPAALH